MRILVTGGAGYIGSHTIIELITRGHEVVVADNLCNSNKESLVRVAQITGKEVPFRQIDLVDKKALRTVFEQYAIDAVIHFAGLKAVGESISQPLEYYRNNIDSTLSLCELMREFGVKTLVFSSSATVYGLPEELPVRETSRTGIGLTNPYGQTKFMLEQILTDLVGAEPEWRVTLLRYFNPVGAHPSGRMGEDPNGQPTNLMPIVLQAATGKREFVPVLGSDWDTRDGTCLRDYIHVVDLAKGHVAALDHLPRPGNVATYNLGTGGNVSVLEMIAAMEKAAGKKIPFKLVERRPGDLGSCYADVSKANRELSWSAEKTIEDACNDAWRWQSQNPHGYSQP